MKNKQKLKIKVDKEIFAELMEHRLCNNMDNVPEYFNELMIEDFKILIIREKYEITHRRADIVYRAIKNINDTITDDDDEDSGYYDLDYLFYIIMRCCKISPKDTHKLIKNFYYSDKCNPDLKFFNSEEYLDRISKLRIPKKLNLGLDDDETE